MDVITKERKGLKVGGVYRMSHYLTLLKMAEKTISATPEAETDSVDDRLLLSIPEPERHNGYRVRLFRDRGPYAVIVNGRNGRLTVYTSARRVRDYLLSGGSNG